MTDIMFRNRGETREGQTQGGGRSHSDVDIEGVRIVRLPGKFRLSGLKKRGPAVSELAGCFWEVGREDRDALEAVITELRSAIESPHAPPKPKRPRKKVAA